MSNKIVIVFPGQGSQKVGMGLDIYKDHHIAKQVFEEVDDSLNQNLSKTIFEGPEEELTFTPNTQPALMAVSIAITRVIEHELNKKITDFSEVILGHSLGEYSALCSLASIDLKSTALLLKIRGEAMQNAVRNLETKMTAVIGLELEMIENVINQNTQLSNDVCEIANDNCPGQIILSGTKNGVELICEELKKIGARSIIDLKVSAPFHCKLMKDASVIMEKNLDEIDLKELKSKFISNVTANFEDDPIFIKKLLVKQVCSRVKWRESIIKSTNKSNFIVEIGSGRILTGMNKRINKKYESLSVSNLQEIYTLFERLKEIL